MSILKRVPGNIRDLRILIQNDDKYYYLAKDSYVDSYLDEDGVEQEVEVPRQLRELGYFSRVYVIPHNGIPLYQFKRNRNERRTMENGGAIMGNKLEDPIFANRLVYTDYPPAAGSVPLTYDNYLESMRVNDFDGGRKKTRNRTNKKFKKTRKHRGKQRNQ